MEKLMIFNFQVKINCFVSVSRAGAGAVIYIEPADQSAASRVIPQFREVTEREREREAEEVRGPTQSRGGEGWWGECRVYYWYRHTLSTILI